ncbi:Hypothetical predicted protein, partial [Olea europaea subsp. europaea]
SLVGDKVDGVIEDVVMFGGLSSAAVTLNESLVGEDGGDGILSVCKGIGAWDDISLMRR